MRILLDTQVWLWMQIEPDLLLASALELVSDPDNDRLLSTASAWEIAIKHSLGKLPLPEAPSEYVPTRMATSVTMPLPVTLDHALRVAELPRHHGDPFDRMLVAQAQLERLPILTADPRLRAYDVEILDARRPS